MSTMQEHRPATEPSPAGPPVAQAPRHRRRRRGWWIAAWVVVALVVLVHLGGGWYFAGRIESQALASNPATGTPVYDDVVVVAFTPDTITLKRGPDAADNFDAAGQYGLAWQGGTGVLDHAVTVNPDGTVTRPFVSASGTWPTVGQSAAVDRSFWFEAITLGSQPRLPTELRIAGLPAWLYRAGDTPTPVLTVFVHGQDGTRLDGLRLADEAIVRTDVLLISYRNDAGTLEDESGRLQYGQTEWRDLDAAVQWALSHGSKSVVLAGQSMGGAIVAAFLENSPRRDAVEGVVLDAPMLSLDEIVRNGAAAALPGGLAVPGTVVWAAEILASLRYGVDWSAVDYLDDTAWLTVPALVLHGADDPTVPVSVSLKLREMKPDLVQLAVFPKALHAESWNVDPQRYASLVGSFLDRVG